MTNKSAMEKLFKRAWEKNERGTAYLAFMEELPEKLKDYGLVNGKTKISQYVFYKLINKHKFSGEELYSVKQALENPVAIFKDGERVIILTDVVDHQKYPVTVILAANKEDNCVASIYGRHNILNYVCKYTKGDDVLFMDLDRIEYIRGDKTNKEVNERLDEIKRNVLKSKGCKLKMTIERDGRKIELTEKEIWDAYNLVNKNITSDIEQEAEKILNQELEERNERVK